MFRFPPALLAALLSLAILPAAAQEVDPRLAQAMAICMDNYPRVGDVRAEALTAGFRSEGRRRGLDLYTAYGRQLFVAFRGGDVPGCIFGLEGLRDEAAIAAAQATVAQRFGSDVVRIGASSDSQFIDGLVAPVPSGGVLIAVGRNTTFSRFHGSPIVVRPFDPNQ